MHSIVAIAFVPGSLSITEFTRADGAPDGDVWPLLWSPISSPTATMYASSVILTTRQGLDKMVDTLNRTRNTSSLETTLPRGSVSDLPQLRQRDCQSTVLISSQCIFIQVRVTVRIQSQTLLNCFSLDPSSQENADNPNHPTL